jgi:hypothetical protein
MTTGQKVLIGVTITFVTIAVVGGVLTIAGFASTGIVAKSIASLIHSTIGDVAAGSIFAIVQSLGAKGYLMKGLFVIIPIITGTLGECLYKKLCPVPAL